MVPKPSLENQNRGKILLCSPRKSFAYKGVPKPKPGNKDKFMSLNTTITQSPIILFLGAGASVPLGKPAMKKFVEKLSNEITFGIEASLLSALISVRGLDLELILEDLETFLNLQYISSFLFDGDKSRLEVNRSQIASLRSLLRRSIIREYSTIDTIRAVEAYKPLFDIIFSHIDSSTFCLPIFTTNYDPAIEKFCSDQFEQYYYINGMEEDIGETYWNPSEFERFRIRPENLNIVLFKLHGSVNWISLTENGKIVQVPMYDVFDTDEYRNAIIYPASNKLTNSEPYLTCYHYFSKCCEHAKIILAIGYSFRDYEALGSLLKARQVNEDLKLILLSPDANSVLETIPDEDKWLWTNAIYGYFGNHDSEAEYLPEIDKWLLRQLGK
jgi:hypothetical protein